MNKLDLKSILNEKFSNLGNAVEISPMVFDFKVNNSLYLYQTDSGKFVVKEMFVANDFYGTPYANERLELISQVTNALKLSGLPIESIQSSSGGEFTIPFGNNVLRVFDYFESEIIDPSIHKQFQQMILLTRKLHEAPIEELIMKFPKITSLLVAPYGLDETLGQFNYLQTCLSKETNGLFKVKDILSLIFEKGLFLTEWNTEIKPVLTHMDFHPRNVLWGKNKSAIMIDMDYLRVGNPYLCLGLTLTRTLLYLNKEVSSQNILQLSTEIYLNYSPRMEKREFVSNLLKGALLCEVEKILRNLYRYYKTGEYRKFAEDVVTIHLPLFLNLLKIEDDIIKGS